MEEERDQLEFEICIVGGGPAGLATAIRLAQLVQDHNQAIENGTKEGTAIDMEDRIAVLEKGPTCGAHGFSGAVFEMKSLRTLLPDMDERNPPAMTGVRRDGVYNLSQTKSTKLPVHPPGMKNKGKHVVSLAQLAKWLGEIAEEMGIMVIPEFAAVDLLTQDGKITGVRTDDKEYGEDGKPQMLGTDIITQALVLAEGPSGTITKKAIKQFDLQAGKPPQSYEYGVKEIWEVPEGQIQPGDCFHTMGYPMGENTGGTFIYGMPNNQVVVGLVYYLKNADPFLDAHRSLQEFKQHPFVHDIIKGGKLLAYGGKAVPGGGYNAIPKLYADNVVLVGDSAGLLNPQSFKGIHYAIQSGIDAAEALFQGMVNGDYSEQTLKAYSDKFYKSTYAKELRRSRNFTKAVHRGLLFPAAFDIAFQTVFGGASFFSGDKVEKDRTYTQDTTSFYGEKREYPELVKTQEDRNIYDKLSDVYLTGTSHNEHQPSHLKVADFDICAKQCFPDYQGPCTHFCPASVYERQIKEDTGEPYLVVNFSNCIHCKTCDIKCPFDNIEWTPPQAGEGPRYSIT